MSETLSGAWRSKRCPAKPTKKEELVDLGRVFGVSFGGNDDESDASDTEFAPENVILDSEDSHEFEGDDGAKSVSSSASSQVLTCHERNEGEEDEEEWEKEVVGGSEEMVPVECVYNPFVVRRSQRAIKPTKDVDLYLLGAQYGVDVDGSDVDSSDQEFAPESVSDVCSSGSSGSAQEDNMDANSVAPDAPTDEDEMVEVCEVVQDTACSPHKFQVLLCSVCLGDSCEDGELVECDGCGIAVHEGCYGVPEEEDADDNRSDLSSFTTIPWFCEPCKAGISSSLCSCDLCPNKGGLFKQTIHGRWVHMVCVLYTPSIEYVEPGQLCGVTLDQLPASRWGSKVCQLCEDVKLSKCGICIGCDAGLCKSSFHVTCAQQHGLLCEVDYTEDGAMDEVCDPFFAHCKVHADKDLTKRKRRDYLTVMKSSNSFQCGIMEERTRHYLEEAKMEYKDYFRKMQDYFQPEKGFRKEERWLHSVPSALQRLTLKAHLLGHASEEIANETRWKVVPGLTTEFVKYFHERQKLMLSLEQQRQVLQQTHSYLQLQQMHVREDMNTLSQSLNKLNCVGKESQGLIASMHHHLTDIGLKEQELPVSGELEEMVSSEVLGGGECTVCEGKEDEHLMMECDTCQHHYHIHCLDPPLSKVPRKSSKWGWQCHSCCYTSGDELRPTSPNFDEPSSRSGRRIKVPKVLSYPDQKVKPSKKKKSKLNK